MNFNNLLKSLFGDKSTRDMKLSQPLVESVKAVSPEIEKLSNDELRARSRKIQLQVQEAAKKQKIKIAELKATIEDTPIDEREEIFNQIDKMEKTRIDASQYSQTKDEYLPFLLAALACFVAELLVRLLILRR